MNQKPCPFTDCKFFNNCTYYQCGLNQKFIEEHQYPLFPKFSQVVTFKEEIDESNINP